MSKDVKLQVMHEISPTQTFKARNQINVEDDVRPAISKTRTRNSRLGSVFTLKI